MKYLWFATIAALASGIPTLAAEQYLFVLSGQSNMAGLSPAISFTPTVEAAFGNENVVVVKDAQGGQPIRRWYKEWKPAQGAEPRATGDLYDRLMKKVKTASEEKTFTSVTFVWMQGERDAREKHGEVYAASFKGLINQLSADMKRNDINFVIGRISDFVFGARPVTVPCVGSWGWFSAVSVFPQCVAILLSPTMPLAGSRVS